MEVNVDRKTITMTVLGCALMAATLVGCDLVQEPTEEIKAELFEGTEKFNIAGDRVNVSCTGSPVSDGPIVLLLHGGGDDLTKMADFQKAISAERRVCSYDRLGAGKSDKPDGKQDYDDVGKTLTGVIDAVAGGDPVVLAGHSMGGLIAGRYAPEHKDKVAGMVLLDATSPSAVADLKNRIPESATGEAGDLRAQTLAIYGGGNPEKLVFADGEVDSAGDVPVQVIQHGKQYLAAVPEYGEGLEEDWTAGQEAWLKLSGDSARDTASDSGHYIYTEAPDLAEKAVADVASRAKG